MSAPTEEPVRKPIRLRPNRVRRLYRGGRLLEQFRRIEAPQDGWYPEDWLGSVVASRLDPEGKEGLSFIEAGETGIAGRARGDRTGDGSIDGGGEGLGSSSGGRSGDSDGDRSATADGLSLAQALAAWPVEFLGEEHVRRFGAHPALLVKLLDSAVRLGIQAHPDRETAMRLLGSPFGKTEAWIVLETRAIDGVAPYILLGFTEEATPAAFDRAVRRGDVAAMEQLLHRFEVRPGDVFWVEAGTPHAIGPGIFMVEVQEPADMTVYCEPGGDRIDAMNAHLGLRWPEAAQAFSPVGRSRAEALARWRLAPHVLWQRGGEGRLEALLDGPGLRKYFRAYRLGVDGRLALRTRGFSLAIVTRGAGRLAGAGFTHAVERGDTYLLPACLGEVVLERDGGPGAPALEVITCHPPAVDPAASDPPLAAVDP